MIPAMTPDPYLHWDHLPQWHPGPCRWFNHPIHKTKILVIRLLAQAGL